MLGLLSDLVKAGLTLALEVMRDEVRTRRERRSVAHQQARIRAGAATLRAVPK